MGTELNNETAQTAEQLWHTARELFCKEGYHNISLRRLATEIGIQVGSLYSHIESKLNLLFELIEEYESNYLCTLRSRATPLGSNPILNLNNVLECSITFLCSNRYGSVLSRYELRHLSPPQRKHIEKIRQKRMAVLQSTLRHGQIQGVFVAADPKTMAQGILSMLDGVLEWCGDDEIIIQSAAKSLQQMTLVLVGTKKQTQFRKL